MKKIKITKVGLNLGRTFPSSYGSKLRGFFAETFKEDVLFHNHKDDGDYNYAYPLIQYKIISGVPYLIGINEGSNLLLEKVLNLKHIILANKKYEILKFNVEIQEEDLFVDEETKYKYQFANNWLALSQDNFKLYKNIIKKNTDKKELLEHVIETGLYENVPEQKKLLEKILIGNILSLATGIDWYVKENIKVRLIPGQTIYPKVSSLKDTKMIAFNGTFISNVKLPNLIGLGKSVSRGFGAVRNVSQIN
ncbi:MAG: CRISPR-associated endonuclease Cas6 [Candidatus Woesearchaeota archaeon]